MIRAVAAALVLSLAAAPSVARDGATLRLDVRLPSAGGIVRIAVFDREDAFRRSADPVRTAELPARGDRVATVFNDLPPGRYAVVAYQDRDSNGKLDLWPVGAPKEPYGYSRDARNLFGPAAWSRASFQLTAEGGAQSFTLK